MLRLWLAMCVGAAFVVASTVIASMNRAEPGVDPVSVVTDYEMARNRHDIDAALTYFSDSAVISQRNTTFAGKDEIRKYLDMVSTRSRYIVVSDRQASGNIVSWTERQGLQSPEPPTRVLPPAQNNTGGTAPQGTTLPGYTGRNGSSALATQQSVAQQSAGFAVTVEAVVQDGKIQSMAYVFGSPVGRVDTPVDGRAQLPASIGFAAVVLVMLGLLLVTSVGAGRTTSGASSLRGRLMHDLQGWAAARQ